MIFLLDEATNSASTEKFELVTTIGFTDGYTSSDFELTTGELESSTQIQSTTVKEICGIETMGAKKLLQKLLGPESNLKINCSLCLDPTIHIAHLVLPGLESKVIVAASMIHIDILMISIL